QADRGLASCRGDKCNFLLCGRMVCSVHLERNRCIDMRNETRNPLRRSFTILRYLIDAGGESVGVRKMAADLGMAPSSIHRLLAALVEEGLVTRHEANGAYSIGAEMIRLCHLATGQL